MSLLQRLQKSVVKFRRGPTTQDLTKKMVLSVVKTRAFPSLTQWKHLPKSLTTLERHISLVAILALGASLLFLGGRYLLIHQTSVPAVGGEYAEALIGTPQFVNPLYAERSDVDRDLTRLVFSGLLEFDGAKLVPDLAESYDVSDDGKTYTFVIKSGVRWHDGQALTVSDVIGTFAMLQNPEYLSPLQPTFRDVVVTQVDDRTLQFTLPEPFAPFLSTLTVGILPAHVWEVVQPKTATLAEANLQPIGTGPYQFEKFSKDKLGNIRSYTLVRNAAYYGQPAKIERLTFRFYPDVYSALDALTKKNVEGVSYVPPDRLPELAADKDLQVLQPFIPQYTALFFNEVQADVLKDLKVRQALAMAIDRQGLLQNALQGSGRIVDSPVLPGMLGFNAEAKMPAFDVEAGKALLDEAGKKLEEGQTSRFALTLTTIDNPEFFAVSQFIKNAWEAIGVEVTVKVVDFDTLQSKVLKERDYDVLLSGEFLMNGDPDPYLFWHSSQADYPGFNIALYQNRKVDTLIEEAREATDQAVREAKYREFQTLLIADLPAIFLYQPTYGYATSSRIKGIKLDNILSPADRFAQIEEWYLKTRRVLK